MILGYTPEEVRYFRVSCHSGDGRLRKMRHDQALLCMDVEYAHRYGVEAEQCPIKYLPMWLLCEIGMSIGLQDGDEILRMYGR